MSDDSSHSRLWTLKAESDLKTARSLLSTEGPFDTACFHSQQAAEKFLKAILAAYGQPIIFTHDLQSLHAKIMELNPEFGVDVDDLDNLTPHAVQSRYDLEYWPTYEKASELLARAERVRAFSLDILDKMI